jgi:hypothetical protein
MISRSAQLKGQDQKVTYFTDDFTMRDFIAVSDPWSFCVLSSMKYSFLFVVPQNPRFVQGAAYEPLTLNIPLLGVLAGETSRNSEGSADEIEGVRSVETSFEERRPRTEDPLTLKKRRTLRFAE